MGRVTYQEMASYWPTATGDYAAFMNDLPKVVFSSSLRSAHWASSRIASGSLDEEIAALKGEPGGEIMVHGGAGFVQSLSRHGLIDERIPAGHRSGGAWERAAAVQGPGKTAANEPHRRQDIP